jgi:formylglycine-generating enzyme required for sulfatase activity
MKSAALAILFSILTTLAGLADSPPRIINEGYGEFLYVPAGPFLMGDNFGDGDSRERPVHRVSLDAYYIGKFEITNQQWRRFREDPGYADPRFWPDGRVLPKDQIPYWIQPQNHGGALPGNEDYPVLGVNWDGATAYCRWVSAQTGQSYRLPTEAEWEKAARGTDQRKYPWGNQIDHSYANYVGSQAYDTGRPVGFYNGSKRGELATHDGSSPYGAQDMAGNVMEWCQDWYAADAYQFSSFHNPTGPPTGAYRVVRGGTFFMEAQDQRTTLRSAAWPSLQSHRMLGFRAVRQAEPATRPAKVGTRSKL